MKFPTKNRYASATFVAALSIIALTACSTSGAAPEATSPGDAGAQVAAQEVVDQYTAEQPALEIADLPGVPEKNLTIAIITCPLPVCHTETDAAAEGAAALGWTIKQYESDLTPEGYVNLWDEVLQGNPDLIVNTPVVPDAAIEDKLAEAASRGVPVVALAPAGDHPNKDGPVYAAYTGVPQFLQSGKLMADVVVADGGTGAETVFIWDAALSSIWDPIKKGFVDEVATSGSDPAVAEMPTTGIGTAVPGQVVSYLQSHPDVKYVVFALADYTAGVPEAIAAAGLSDSVKIITRAPQAANLANIKDGKEFAAVAEENSASGWRSIDGLARLTLGETPDDSWFEPAGWAQIFTKDNVTQTTEPPQTPGTPDAFLAAWGLN